MYQKEINDREWNDLNNWRLYLFYYSTKDSRVWVPKPLKWTGWTLNFAKPQNYIWLLALIIIPILVIN